MKHQFALYASSLSQELRNWQAGDLIPIEDTELVHRITHVLRLKQFDEIILFDRIGHAVVTIQEITKKHVVCSVQSYVFNKIFEPSITVVLPLLKKEALEEALYATVELGASVVQLVKTEKTQRSWGGAKEYERAQRIMIAASEQSKNFAIPELHQPKTLRDVVQDGAEDEVKIFFDPEGRPLLSLMNMVHETKPSSAVCLVGPEGDLTESEKALVAKHGFKECKLTPTVVRSVQALNVGLGALRSI